MLVVNFAEHSAHENCFADFEVVSGRLAVRWGKARRDVGVERRLGFLRFLLAWFTLYISLGVFSRRHLEIAWIDPGRRAFSHDEAAGNGYTVR